MQHQVLHHFYQCDGAHAVGVVFGYHFHAALTVFFPAGGNVFVQRQVYDFQLGGPQPFDNRQIRFASFAVFKLRLQVHQRAAPLGDQQYAAGFFVQPVHQF